MLLNVSIIIKKNPQGKTDQSGELSSVSSDPKSADLTAVVKRQVGHWDTLKLSFAFFYLLL